MTAASRAAEILINFFPGDAVQREGLAGQWLIRGAPGAFAACRGVCCRGGLWYVLMEVLLEVLGCGWAALCVWGLSAGGMGGFGVF